MTLSQGDRGADGRCVHSQKAFFRLVEFLCQDYLAQWTRIRPAPSCLTCTTFAGAVRLFGGDARYRRGTLRRNLFYSSHRRAPPMDLAPPSGHHGERLLTPQVTKALSNRRDALSPCSCRTCSNHSTQRHAIGIHGVSAPSRAAVVAEGYRSPLRQRKGRPPICS
jgi:hypothetical protein